MLEFTKIDRTLGGLKFALDGLSARQNIISNNIANIDTPGFKGGEVNFETHLRRYLNDNTTKMTTTHHLHYTSSYDINNKNGIIISKSNNTSIRNDGNNVDIDKEMAQMAETNILYNALVQRISGKLGTIRTVINEGR